MMWCIQIHTITRLNTFIGKLGFKPKVFENNTQSQLVNHLSVNILLFRNIMNISKNYLSNSTLLSSFALHINVYFLPLNVYVQNDK